MVVTRLAVLLVFAGCVPSAAEDRRWNSDILDELRHTAATPECPHQQVQVACIRTKQGLSGESCIAANVEACGTSGGRYVYWLPSGADNEIRFGLFHWHEQPTNFDALRNGAASLARKCQSPPELEMREPAVYKLVCLDHTRDWAGDPDCSRAEISACRGSRIYRLVPCESRCSRDPAGASHCDWNDPRCEDSFASAGSLKWVWDQERLP